MADQLLLVNPRKRRRKKKTKSKKRRARRKSNPIVARRGSSPRKRITRRRRNPSPRTFIKTTLLPSATGAIGALGVDVLMGVLPLPITFTTGLMRPVAKGAAAVGMGMLASMVVSRKMAEQFTAGALTVVVYDTLKTFIQTNVPQIPLSDMDYDDLDDDLDDLYPELSYAGAGATMDDDDDDGMSAYVDDGMSAYVDDGMGDDGMGAYMEQEPELI